MTGGGSASGGAAGSAATGGTAGSPGTGGAAGSPATGGAGGSGGAGAQGGEPPTCRILIELGGFIDDVLSVAADGSGEVNLTDRDGVQGQPVWSPDGTRVAYVSNPGNIVTGDIHAMNADGSNDMPLTSETNYEHPVWSPDATTIAFSGGSGNDIFVVPSDGSASAANLTNDAAMNEDPEWSPDGSKIVFVRREMNTDQEIFVMDADGGNLTNLTNDPPPACPTCNGIADQTPVWSPDGTKIAYLRDDPAAPGAGWALMVMGSDGSNPTELDPATGRTDPPSWSPDSMRLTFGQPGDGFSRAQTWVIDADGQNATRLTGDTVASITRPQFSPDGQRIAAVRVTAAGTSPLVAFPASDGSAPTTLSPSDVTGIPQWSPLCPWCGVVRAMSRAFGTAHTRTVRVLKAGATSEWRRWRCRYQ